MTPELIQQNLTYFNGSDTFYEHYIGPKKLFIYTEGIKYLADNTGLYWYLDYIGLHNQSLKVLKLESFQSWVLKKIEDRWLITCDDGNKNILFTGEIEYSDFILAEITVWLVDGVLLLPSEY